MLILRIRKYTAVMYQRASIMYQGNQNINYILTCLCAKYLLLPETESPRQPFNYSMYYLAFLVFLFKRFSVSGMFTEI